MSAIENSFARCVEGAWVPAGQGIKPPSLGGTQPHLWGLPPGRAVPAQAGLMWAGNATSAANPPPSVWFYLGGRSRESSHTQQDL